MWPIEINNQYHAIPFFCESLAIDFVFWQQAIASWHAGSNMLQYAAAIYNTNPAIVKESE